MLSEKLELCLGHLRLGEERQLSLINSIGLVEGDGESRNSLRSFLPVVHYQQNGLPETDSLPASVCSQADSVP